MATHIKSDIIDYKLSKARVSPKWRKLPEKIRRKVNSKKLMWDAAHLVLDSINQYVPEKTGKLKKKGYVLSVSNSKINPWFKIYYRNTSSMPYVMYQYYGKVWGPNIPKFDKKMLRITDIALPKAEFKYTPKGWYSGKHKHETYRKFARRKTVVKFKRGPFAGRYAIINGYTKNKQRVQPKWVEYAERHKDDFGGYAQPVKLLIEKTFKKALEGN